MGLFGSKGTPITRNAKAMIQTAKEGLIGNIVYGWQFDVENEGGVMVFMSQGEYKRIVAGAIGELTYTPTKVGEGKLVSFKRTGQDANAPKNPFGM